MVKKGQSKGDKIFKIEKLYMNIYEDTYENDYVDINMDISCNDYANSICQTLNTKYQLFDYATKEDIITYKIENKEKLAKDIDDEILKDFKVYSDSFINSGLGILLLYEKIFKVNYIDKNNWSRFIHILGLKENTLIADKSDMNTDNYEIFDYSSCFKENGNTYIINNEYIKKQIKFLNFPSIMASNSYTYELNNTKELIVSFLCNFFRYNGNKIVKKCEHCQKWFIPDKKTTKYCDRVSPKYKNKNCKEGATLLNKLANEKSNEIAYLRKRIRMKYYNPVNIYGKQKDIERLLNFDREDMLWREKLKNNIVTQLEYRNWLNSHFIKKVGGNK